MGLRAEPARDLTQRRFLDVRLEEVQRLIDTNFVGVVRLMLVGRGMVERWRGVIVSMESQTAFARCRNTPPVRSNSEQWTHAEGFNCWQSGNSGSNVTAQRGHG
jgi:NAD(P)-dependent dehydrogenase (short-subunit alcohol dehydrogenase family)